MTLNWWVHSYTKLTNEQKLEGSISLFSFPFSFLSSIFRENKQNTTNAKKKRTKEQSNGNANHHRIHSLHSINQKQKHRKKIERERERHHLHRELERGGREGWRQWGCRERSSSSSIRTLLCCLSKGAGTPSCSTRSPPPLSESPRSSPPSHSLSHSTRVQPVPSSSSWFLLINYSGKTKRENSVSNIIIGRVSHFGVR